MGFSVAVPRFGQVCDLNLARGYLFRASDALKARRLFECGVLLREAIRRQLRAECQWHGCEPESVSDRTPPVTLLKALRKAGHADEIGYETVREIIDVANKLCHARPVKPGIVRDAIAWGHTIIDGDPCLQPANMRGVRQADVPCVCWNYDDGEDPLANADYDADDCDDEGGALVKGGGA